MNKKIRFGVIGTNFVTDWVLEGGRQDPRFEVTALYSRTQEQVDMYAAKHGIPHTFTDLKALAESPLIDAIYIASPNFLHAEQSILFMEHGKHVLCEKPLASNAAEARQMILAAQEYNVTLMEAMKPTLTPGFKAVQQHLKEIGTIRRYFSCYCQYSSRYDKLKEGIVMNAFRPELSNGAVMDVGVYTLYPMVVLFGKPQKVSATGFKLSTGVDAQGAVNFDYDGMTATVLYSKIADSTLPTEIQGEKGTIQLDRINIISDVQLTRRKIDTVSVMPKVTMHEYYYEVAEFIDLIESGKQESTINSWKNSLTTLEIIDEIRRQLDVHFLADNKK